MLVAVAWAAVLPTASPFQTAAVAPPPSQMWPPLVVMLPPLMAMVPAQLVADKKRVRSTKFKRPELELMLGAVRVMLWAALSPARKVSVASPPAVLAKVTPLLQVMLPTTSLSTLVPVLRVAA